jgi:hypothetical protein
MLHVFMPGISAGERPVELYNNSQVVFWAPWIMMEKRFVNWRRRKELNEIVEVSSLSWLRFGVDVVSMILARYVLVNFVREEVRRSKFAEMLRV